MAVVMAVVVAVVITGAVAVVVGSGGSGGNSIGGGGGGVPGVVDFSLPDEFVLGEFTLGDVEDWARAKPELENPTHSAATATRPLRVRMVVAP